jgi:type VI secretion system protein ImpL
MLAFLKRTFVVLFGFLLIVVFIWFAGPYFAFGSYRPLETQFSRLIAIGVVVACWLIAKAVRRLRAFRKSDRLLAAVVAQPQQPEKARTPAEVQKLRDRFDEAVSALKEQRRSGHSLYELPWYVIIGAPGSGKTTALLNSGLKFPIEQRVGKGALRGVGGTRNCDWWFTDEAIFLDTAGRYTTQDSDAASDSLGWSEFLALLRKYRARRPINGVILTINAHDLIVESAAAREAHVEAARSRLEELNRELRIQLPVYLMVTKCDLVDGFAEYFDDLSAEGRAQVWGVTFPYEQTLANEGPQAFSGEFDALMTRLNERVFDRVEEVRETRRRGKVFAFPQQMATMRDALTRFVTDVFDSRQFTGQVLLRGVYFTSGTQDGTPIDRLLGSIGRTFGQSVKASSGPGKAYFVESLLKDVMIGESGLAGVNRGLETRKAAAQLGAYAAAGLIAAVGVLAFSYSYSRNRDFLDQTAVQVAALDAVPQALPNAPIDRIVPRLDAIRAIVSSSEHYRENTSWPMRWGLYQGSSIAHSAHDAYLRELDTVLMPRVASLIRTRMIQHGSNPERLFAYFKGYLMLGDPARVDKTHLKAIADSEWKSPSAPASGAALSTHFQAVLDEDDTLRPVALDPTLVSQVRSSLRRAPMAKILYEDIKREYAAAGGGFRLDQAVGLDVEKVFSRRDATWSTPMPQLYTRDVFKKITNEGQAVLMQKLATDSWVWGDDITSAISNTRALVAGVFAHYERDYSAEWDEFLDTVQLIPSTSIAHANEQLRILTSPSSPLRAILRVVAEQTTLQETAPAAAAPASILDKTRKSFSEVIGSVQSATGTTALPSPGLAVTARFQWVRQLTAGQTGQTPLDTILKTMTDIQQELDKVGIDIAAVSPMSTLTDPRFRTLTQVLRQQATALPGSMRDIVTEIVDAPIAVVRAGATRDIETRYLQEIVPQCRTLIANRYPFGNLQEVQLADFGAVFGFDGLFDKFFRDNLLALVETSRSPWAWKEGSVNPERRILDQFEAARRIRDAFFPAGSKTPEVGFYITVIDLDAGASRFVLQVDGKNFEGRRGELVRRTAVWPGPTPGQAIAAFEALYYDPPTPYGGPWAWFKMIDATAEGPADAQGTLVLRMQNRDHLARVRVEPVRAGNSPFSSWAWRQFSCES